MYFFKDNHKLYADHLIPTYPLICDMKENANLLSCYAGELSVGDVVFDIVFLRITKKTISQGKKTGYSFCATNSLDHTYNAFMWEDTITNIVNPEYIETLISMDLYSN